MVIYCGWVWTRIQQYFNHCISIGKTKINKFVRSIIFPGCLTSSLSLRYPIRCARVESYSLLIYLTYLLQKQRRRVVPTKMAKKTREKGNEIPRMPIMAYDHAPLVLAAKASNMQMTSTLFFLLNGDTTKYSRVYVSKTLRCLRWVICVTLGNQSVIPQMGW